MKTFILIFLFSICTLPRVDANENQPWDPQKITLSYLYGTPEFVHGGHISHIISLSDGKRVMTSGHDGSVRVWDIKTGKELARFAYYSLENNIWDFKLLPGEKEFLSAYGSVVIRWDLKSGKSLAKYINDTSGNDIYCMAVSDDGKIFAAVGINPQIKIWDFVNSDKPLKTINGPIEPVFAAEFINNDLTLVTGGSDASIDFWDIARGSENLKIQKKEFEDIYTIKKSTDGKKMLICTSDNNIMGDTTDGHTIWQSKFPVTIKDASWSPDGTFIAALCDNNQLYILDATTGKTVNSIVLPKGRIPHRGVAYSKDGKKIFCGVSHKIYIFESETGKREFPPPEENQVLTSAIKDVVVNENLNRLYYNVDEGKGLNVIDLKTGKRLAIWLPDKEIGRVFISPNRKELYYFDNKAPGKLFAIDAESGKELFSNQISTKSFLCYSFSHNKKYLALGCSDYNIYIWDLKKKKVVKTFSRHTGWVNDLEYGLNDNLIYSISTMDNTFRIWDVITGKNIHTIKGGDEDENDYFVFCREVPGINPQIMATKNGKVFRWDLPSSSMKEEDKLQIIELIKRLNADEFKDREKATQDLIKIGSPILKMLNSIRTDNPETKNRIELTVKEIIKSNKFLKDPIIDEQNGFNSLAFHPQGKYLIFTTDVGLEIAEIKEGKLRIIRTITDNNNPDRIVFAESGNIYTANKNGTISKYSLSE